MQQSGGPTLFIRAAGPGQVTISWELNTPGFVLQETPDLAPGRWTNSPGGSANPVTVPASDATRYYRLNKP